MHQVFMFLGFDLVVPASLCHSELISKLIGQRRQWALEISPEGARGAHLDGDDAAWAVVMHEDT